MSLSCDCCSVISNATTSSPGVCGACTFAIWLTDSVSQKSCFTLASGVGKIEFPTVHSRTLLTRLQASPSRNTSITSKVGALATTESVVLCPDSVGLPSAKKKRKEKKRPNRLFVALHKQDILIHAVSSPALSARSYSCDRQNIN